MALTTYVEMREGERWQDVAGAFMLWCHQHKRVATGGCHEGDAGGPADGRRYAALSIPDHSPVIAGYLREWASSEGRAVGSRPDAEPGAAADRLSGRDSTCSAGAIGGR